MYKLVLAKVDLQETNISVKKHYSLFVSDAVAAFRQQREAEGEEIGRFCCVIWYVFPDSDP